MIKRSASRFWKAPAEMSSQKTENYNNCSAGQHSVCITQNIPGKNADESTYEGGAGIKVLYKNIGHQACHAIAQYAAADTGDHADKAHEIKPVITGDIISHADTHHGEDAETHAVHHKQQQVA